MMQISGDYLSDGFRWSYEDLERKEGSGFNSVNKVMWKLDCGG